MLVKTGIIMFFFIKTHTKSTLIGVSVVYQIVQNPKTKIHLSRCCVKIETSFLIKIMLDIQKI